MRFSLTDDTDKHEAALYWLKLGLTMKLAKPAEDEIPLGLPAVDECMQKALFLLEEELITEKKKFHGYDYAWILHLTENDRGKTMPVFNGVSSFREYLLKLGITRVCGISTLSQYYNKVSGTYPNLSFTDEPGSCDGNERLRRINIARRFLVIHRQLCKQYHAIAA